MTTALHPDAALPGGASDETARQPYAYRRRPLEEPDWRRLPGWRDVTREEWESAQWQRAHCVKNLRQLRQVMGDRLDESFYADLERDQAERATMSMLLPPQMLNTMDSSSTDAFYADPVRRYMLPVFSDRRTDWPSHPLATRDSLHEAEMWAVEGLTHRYPTKVLAELLPTCPQYCGHCTRMDLVGNSTPNVDKHKFTIKPPDRLGAMVLINGVPFVAATPIVAEPPRGAGDLFAALFFGQYLRGLLTAQALDLATRGVYHVLAQSARAPEMNLIAEQDALAAPPQPAGYSLGPADAGEHGDG